MKIDIERVRNLLLQAIDAGVIEIKYPRSQSSLQTRSGIDETPAALVQRFLSELMRDPAEPS